MTGIRYAVVVEACAKYRTQQLYAVTHKRLQPRVDTWPQHYRTTEHS